MVAARRDHRGSSAPAITTGSTDRSAGCAPPLAGSVAVTAAAANARAHRSSFFHTRVLRIGSPYAECVPHSRVVIDLLAAGTAHQAPSHWSASPTPCARTRNLYLRSCARSRVKVLPTVQRTVL